MILCYKIDRIPVNYDKEEYIGTVIKVGGILIGSIMVLFVIWYIVKDILDISGKDSSDGQ